ncbi:ATP-dependent endonuclease [Agromyces sp. NPDC058110]|uniref:ATP-dependent nuclease n=1 Tax=Agromyces sp. NPDC058110 TaxID=3346345 RepID=UPI0036DEEE91
MKLRKLTISNFRGIKTCEWILDANFVALVGPGDSTKTTLVDAIGHVLTSRYNVTFTDADFYGCDTTEPIVIEAVVVDLPTPLIEERSHGKNRSGIHDDGTLEHDPIEEADVKECLIVRLTVDQTLEPLWEVVRPGETEGERISAAERAQLGFFRIGDYVDQHLRWGRGSALSSLTSSKTDATHAVVEAQRQARQAVRDLPDNPLHTAATLAQAEVKKLGSGPFVDLRPGLDPALGAANSALVLHDGNIPLTQFGLGSRRLLSLSIQENALAGNSIVAIDEVESGLDPHRLSHLIRYLRERAANDDLQVILSTHSALVVEALSYDQLFVVRSAGGTTTANRVPAELEPGQSDVLQGVMRERPSSLLAQSVVVGEGATEVGFIRELLHEWDSQRPALNQVTSVTAGVGVTNGSGSSQAPKRAQALALLGYPTMLVIDGDVTDNASDIAAAAAAGVVVVQWPTGMALEDVVAAESSIECLQAIVDAAADERSAQSVANAVGARLGQLLTGVDVAAWIAAHNEHAIRTAIGAAAKGAKANGTKTESNAWFKREDRGAQLGAIVRAHSAYLSGEVLKDGVRSLKDFVYGAEEIVGPATAEDE